MAKVLQNRYQIKDTIGHGGMGTVYVAEDLHVSNRQCVVKQLRDDFYRDEDRQRAVGFFKREVGMLARLDHPNIVRILDYFEEGGQYFLVMEYVMGEDFHAIMQERDGEPYEESSVIAWSIEICDVLAYLHSQNPPVVYRDLKPSNIMLNTKGQVKLVDFGIARPFDEDNENTSVVSAGYSPPEQYWGAASPQSDIYALGATIFFLLTGKDPEPLKANSPKSVNPAVSDYVDELVVKAMAQEPAERFANVQEMRESLLHAGFEEAPENPQSWFKRAVFSVILVALIALALCPEAVMNAFRVGTSKTEPGDGGTQNQAGARNPQDPMFGGILPQRGFALQVSDEESLTDHQLSGK